MKSVLLPKGIIFLITGRRDTWLPEVLLAYQSTGWPPGSFSLSFPLLSLSLHPLYLSSLVSLSLPAMFNILLSLCVLDYSRCLCLLSLRSTIKTFPSTYYGMVKLSVYILSALSVFIFKNKIL